MQPNKSFNTTENIVAHFLDSFVGNEQKYQDCQALLILFQQLTGYEPTLWGTSIIGFGSYHYKYASGHEGDAPLVGFSPRKNEISLYLFSGLAAHQHLLEHLGKIRTGKACIYIKRLSDVNIDALKKLTLTTVAYLKSQYEQSKD